MVVRLQWFRTVALTPPLHPYAHAGSIAKTLDTAARLTAISRWSPETSRVSRSLSWERWLALSKSTKVGSAKGEWWRLLMNFEWPCLRVTGRLCGARSCCGAHCCLNFFFHFNLPHTHTHTHTHSLTHSLVNSPDQRRRADRTPSNPPAVAPLGVAGDDHRRRRRHHGHLCRGRHGHPRDV